MSRFCRALLLAVVVGGLAAPGSAAPAPAAAATVAPIQSKPHGLSYAEWGVRWYEWAFATPADVNPLVGNPCGGGQAGKVWFLHGVLGAGDGEFSCRVPSGTALFLPLINNAYGAFLNDPPETRTDAFVRAAAVCHADALHAEIDGRPVLDPARFRVDAQRSPLFDVQLPEDNILGLTEADAEGLMLSPVAQSGYYLFLHPLAPGTHIIEWQARGACGAQDVRWTVEVVPRGRF
jgi:hypothetical protein